MQVDLSPIITPLLTIAGIALSTAGTWAIARLAQKLGVDKNSAVMQNLDNAAMKGISAAVMQTQDMIKSKGWDHPDVQSALVAAGVNYVTAKFPGTLAHAGVDVSTPAGQQAVADLITRALPAGVAAAAASPVTPAAPQAKAA